jgi:hypothetical protein
LSESKTVSFRIPQSRLEDVNETINSIADNDDTIKVKGDVLLRLIDYFNSGGSFFKIDVDDPTIQAVLDKVNCGYLEYERESLEKFQCYEKMEGTKKPYPLSPIPERTMKRCLGCIRRKEELRQIAYEKKLEKDMIKKILNFRKMLMTMVGDGFISEVYFCTGDSRENQSIIFSRDNVTLPCPLSEMELVKIHKVCMNTVNPKTDTTPCKYLLMDKHIAKMKKKDFRNIEAEYEEVVEMKPQLEHKEPIEVESKEVNDSE